MLTLARVKELLIQIPHQFLHLLDITGIDLHNNISWQAKDLFKSFTWEIWLSLKEWVMPAGLKPNPLILEAAVLLWTPSEIQKQLTCKFIPPPTGLASGLMGDLDTQAFFRDQRSLFFPTPSKVMGSIWQTYMEHEGYISKYHQFLKKGWIPQKDIEDLHEALDQIFSQLQCLPWSNSQSIWTAWKGEVIFTTNPSYYKVKTINRTSNAGHGPKQPQMGKKTLQEALHGKDNVSC